MKSFDTHILFAPPLHQMCFVSFHHFSSFLNAPLAIYYIDSFAFLALSKRMATNSDSATNLSSAIATSLTITDTDLSDLIKIQGDLVRKLKGEKAPNAQVRYFHVDPLEICIASIFSSNRFKKLLTSYLL
jgi:hypothetical protein